MTSRVKAIFIVIGILIGTFFTSHFKSSAPVSGTFPTDLIAAEKTLTKSFVDEQTKLKQQIVSIRSAIDSAQKKNEKVAEQANLERLEAFKMLLGLKAMKGSGLEIFLDDSFSANRETKEALSQGIIQASDLRDIVNLFRVGGAQAIAVNGQRVIASTSITAVGPNILVNQVPLAPPFSVTAVGNQNSLFGLFKNSTFLSDLTKRKREHRLRFEIHSRSNIFIPIYNGDFRTKFLSIAT